MKKKINIIKTIDGINFVDGYIDHSGIYHPIWGEEVIKTIDENSEEFKYAKWIKNTFGGRIDIVPTINTAKKAQNTAKTQTPDYIWNNERWDLKGINGNTKNTISHIFEDYKNQTDNLILFTRNTKMTNKEIITNISKSLKRYSNYYNRVLFIKNYKKIKEFK